MESRKERRLSARRWWHDDGNQEYTSPEESYLSKILADFKSEVILMKMIIKTWKVDRGTPSKEKIRRHPEEV